MKLKNAEEVYHYFKNKVEIEDKEHLYALFLDVKTNMLGEELISIGKINSNQIYPIDIFLPAIKANAKSVILIHNHPSGNPAPCNEDLMLTETLRKVGELIGIHVLDHIVIGENCFVSF